VWGRSTEPQVRRVDIESNSPMVRGRENPRKTIKSNH